MKISFFEEFPAKSNLERLKLIAWPTKVYLAAKSLEEFNELKNKIKRKNIKEFVYWPVLKKKEGYWISPFARRAALRRIFNELNNTTTPVMLDLELPTTQNPWLYLTELFNFIRNKKLIKNFIKNYRGQVYLAEYYPEGKRKEQVLQAFGIHYQSKKAKLIKMVYHSLHHFNQEFLANELSRGKQEFGHNFLVAYGTTAKGIGGQEPSLSREQLKLDLILAREQKIKEVIIFRLGGLTNEYVRLLARFAEKR